MSSTIQKIHNPKVMKNQSDYNDADPFQWSCWDLVHGVMPTIFGIVTRLYWLIVDSVPNKLRHV